MCFKRRRAEILFACGLARNLTIPSKNIKSHGFIVFFRPVLINKECIYSVSGRKYAPNFWQWKQVENHAFWQTRTHGLHSWEGKTLVGAGYVIWYYLADFFPCFWVIGNFCQNKTCTQIKSGLQHSYLSPNLQNIVSKKSRDQLQITWPAPTRVSTFREWRPWVRVRDPSGQPNIYTWWRWCCSGWRWRWCCSGWRWRWFACVATILCHVALEQSIVTQWKLLWLDTPLSVGGSVACASYKKVSNFIFEIL